MSILVAIFLAVVANPPNEGVPIVDAPINAIEIHKQSMDSIDRVDSARIQLEKKDSNQTLEHILETARENRSTYKIGIYDPTYFGFALRNDYGIASNEINRNDPPHVEFLVSPYIAVNLLPEIVDSLRFNVLYRGLYNFYFATQASGPVISRIQNPEAFFDWKPIQWSLLRRVDLQLGMGHESNGMFVETKGQYDTLMQGMSHRPDGKLPMNPQDFASMGWNYWRLGIKREISVPGNLGVFTPRIELKYLINQDFNSFFTLGHSRIEDSSLFIEGEPNPSIQQFEGLRFGLRYFKTFRRYSPISYVVKSLALEYAGRTGYQSPYNGSGYFQMEGDITLLKLFYEGFSSIPYLGYLFYPFSGFSANIPVFVRWTYGYSENLAYYSVPYSDAGKLSFGFVINSELGNHQ